MSKESYQLLKPFVLEIEKDKYPLRLPSKAYPNPIDTMPVATRPCLYCGEINPYRHYSGSVYNRVDDMLDYVHFNLGFTCSNCRSENNHNDRIHLKYTCSHCEGHSKEGLYHLTEEDLRYYAKKIKEHGCILVNRYELRLSCSCKA